MADTRPPKLLLADDAPALLTSYAAMLEPEYEVQTTTRGEKAISLVDEQTDVVILDRRIPDRSGESVLSEIRARGFDCPVIFCSAVVPDIDIISLDIDEYLHKPVSSEELIGAIERQLRIADHDETAREYLALRAKRTAIEQAGSLMSVEENEQYRHLLDQIDELEQTIDTTQVDPVPVA